MPRPSAIRLFGQLYLAALGLYLLNAALFWSRNRALVAATPQAQANPQVAAMMPGIMLGSLVVTAAVSLLLWWLVTSRRAVAAKWIVVITEGIGALGGLWSLLTLARGLAPNVPGAILTLVSTALAVAAAAMLLRPDAQPWFEDSSPERDRDIFA